MELITMGALCEDAISSRHKALLDGRTKPAADARPQLSRRSTSKERDIENLCMKLLLQQQPVAERSAR
ncbi:MAG: hypothetical protein ACLUJG_08635 [Lawsonibacter sp.]